MLLSWQAAQEIVAAMEQQQKSRLMFIQHRGQTREAGRAHFAWLAFAHNAPARYACKLRRVAFVLARSGTVSEAVAESEHHRVRRQGR